MQERHYHDVRIRIQDPGLRHGIKRSIENTLRAIGQYEPDKLKLDEQYLYVNAPEKVIMKVIAKHTPSKKLKRLVHLEDALVN